MVSCIAGLRRRHVACLIPEMGMTTNVFRISSEKDLSVVAGFNETGLLRMRKNGITFCSESEHRFDWVVDAMLGIVF